VEDEGFENGDFLTLNPMGEVPTLLFIDGTKMHHRKCCDTDSSQYFKILNKKLIYKITRNCRV
jgi:hypothetical protein